MPLPSCISDDDILEFEIYEEPDTSQKIIALMRKVLTKHDRPITNVTYVVDISIHNRQDPNEPLDTSSLYEASIHDDDSADTIAVPRQSSNLIDYRRYELTFHEDGKAALRNYSHKPKLYDGEITNVVMQIAEKPKIKYRALTIPIKEYKFNEDEGEHEIHLSLRDVYNKAMQDLSAYGFPRLKTSQTYRLRLGFYYLNEEIARKSILWNPLLDESENDEEDIADDDELRMDEYINLFPNRPDHVRLHDVRLDSISVMWLQEYINKVLDKRFASLS